MRYIGPFFRMNSLSQQEIFNQLFYFAKESVKSIVLESKCGLTSSLKHYRKSNSTIDITTIGNFSPLLCIYRKSSPNLIHTKSSNSLDEDSFKKDISPTTNALMTLSLLELSDYYLTYKDIDKVNYSFYELYKELSKEQLKFFSCNLRNAEGVFVNKRNTSNNNYKSCSLIDNSKGFNFKDQAYMMLAYYNYYTKFPDEDISVEYKDFSLEILQMFIDYKSKLYECSFEDLCDILLVFNLFYSTSQTPDSKIFLTDLADFLIGEFDDKDYYAKSFEYTIIFSLTLLFTYNHTNIVSFLDKHREIVDRLIPLYDGDKEILYKLDGKKSLKYTCNDIMIYFLLLTYLYKNQNSDTEKRTLSSFYKKYIINSGLITSWPEGPTLDDYERYIGFTKASDDMLDETMFRMSNLPSPNSNSLIPMFYRKISYDKKHDSFSVGSRTSLDNSKNFFLIYSLIYTFKDNYINSTAIKNTINESDEVEINLLDSSTDIQDASLDNNENTVNI